MRLPRLSSNTLAALLIAFRRTQTCSNQQKNIRPIMHTLCNLGFVNNFHSLYLFPKVFGVRYGFERWNKNIVCLIDYSPFKRR